jgi:dTDP-4-dehydrorhamnose reductase
MMQSKKRILITGANGQLGLCIREVAEKRGLSDRLICTDVAELDITNARAINAFFDMHQPGWCINCAAYTAVDKSETEHVIAKKINATAPTLLAKATQKHGAKMIHISTDYVYHTNHNRPYIETDKTSPKGVYAKTKLAGDVATLKHCAQAIVLRTSWVYSQHGANFVKTMLRVGAERSELNVVFDQIGTPTNAMHLAGAILDIIVGQEASEAPLPHGVYHYSNEGVSSWYDFAVAVFTHAQMPVQVHPILSSQYPTPAQRPPFSVLDKSKIKGTFGITIPHWEDGLRDCLRALGVIG